MAEETILEIRLDNLAHNVRFLKSKLKTNTLFMAMVKAFSYGNNHCQIAKFLEKNNLVDYFGVACHSEGVELREAGIKKPILVQSPQIIHFQDITKYNLEPSLYSERILKSFVWFVKEQNLSNYPIHIKCNTGMNRLGFSQNEISKICNFLSENPYVKVKSAYSHLVASEDLSAKDFIQKQITKFIDFQNIIKQYFPKIIFHNCNTSGILNYPDAHFDMVRSGIGIYGFGNDPKYQKNFRPITILKSIISQINILDINEFIGYNFGFQANKKTRSATIPVGHADGLNRIYGKGVGFVYIQGKKAPILGNICMDMLMVDVTHINCQEGDEVIIFDENHTAEILAETAQTISYELVTSMSRRIKRVFITENQKFNIL